MISRGRLDHRRQIEVLGDTAESFLATVKTLKTKGPGAALRQHIKGSSGGRLSDEIQPDLDAVYRDGRLERQWEAFFSDPTQLQLPNWVSTRKRIYLGDYLPERFVSTPPCDSLSFRYDHFVARFYHELPKVRGEDDVFYLFAHGHNPETKYVTRHGRKYAAILVGGKPTTAEELVPILDRLGYTNGNIRMITCWAGGMGQPGTVRPFIHDLVEALKGRAGWVKGTIGALNIQEKGIPTVYTITSLLNRKHRYGDFEASHEIAFDPEAKLEKEVLRFDGSLDHMETATWRGPRSASADTAARAPGRTRPAPLVANSMPQSIYEGGGVMLYFWPDNRVKVMGESKIGTYQRDGARLIVSLPNRRLEMEIGPKGEVLVARDGTRFEQV